MVWDALAGCVEDFRGIESVREEVTGVRFEGEVFGIAWAVAETEGALREGDA